MIKFYPNRTVEEQKARLPQDFQDNYEKTVLDQVEIDGNIIQGYMEYSFLNEKSYFKQPVRSINGAIENINTYATFLTPHLVIKYSMMNIADYRKLMTLLNSKNEFTVTCYDPVLDTRVTHKMYAAPSSMPKIYQQYLMALGIQEFSVELIGTNNGAESYTIRYDYNIPDGWEYAFSQFEATQEFPRSVMGVIGETAVCEYDGQMYRLSEIADSLMAYSLIGWNTKQDGSGFMYMDGDEYLMHASQTLYAQWKYLATYQWRR